MFAQVDAQGVPIFILRYLLPSEKRFATYNTLMEFAKLPNHIAFIMDGNGRWATKRQFGRLRGHRAGVVAVERMVEECQRLGIQYMTLYTFSTENWNRPEEEVTGIFNLLREHFHKKIDELNEKNIRIQFIGNRMPATPNPQGEIPNKIAPDVLQIMQDVEEKTKNNTGLTVRFAINYSGRDEILRAMNFYAEDVKTGAAQPWDLTEEKFESYLDYGGTPAVDLMIRTSGEKRISNFMLWQLAYSEMIFHDAYWPDFNTDKLHECLSEYVKRDRRFGAIQTSTLEDEIDAE